jgi:hypothetical protein
MLTTKLKLTKETAGTHVYKNDEDNAPIPSVYIKKAAFKKDPPKSITIKIEEI